MSQIRPMCVRSEGGFSWPALLRFGESFCKVARQLRCWRGFAWASGFGHLLVSYCADNHRRSRTISLLIQRLRFPAWPFLLGPAYLYLHGSGRKLRVILVQKAVGRPFGPFDPQTVFHFGRDQTISQHRQLRLLNQFCATGFASYIAQLFAPPLLLMEPDLLIFVVNLF